MKEISHKWVIAQRNAEFDRDTRTKAFTEAVVRRVTKEANGKYFQAVPDAYRDFVTAITVSNMDMSAPKSFGELLDFRKLDQRRDEVARSWLVRREVVPHIMKYAGFKDVTELNFDPNQGDFNKATIAALTGKGTLMVVGKGGLVHPDTGAPILWEPLPERHNEEKHVPTLSRGARVIGKPELGKPLEIRYQVLEDERPIMSGSEEAAPLVSIFMGPPDADIKMIEEQIRISNDESARLFGKK